APRSARAPGARRSSTSRPSRTRATSRGSTVQIEALGLVAEGLGLEAPARLVEALPLGFEGRLADDASFAVLHADLPGALAARRDAMARPGAISRVLSDLDLVGEEVPRGRVDPLDERLLAVPELVA